ncbi:hypothetical protein INT80_13270 [Gallibacterium anatis]|uniref:Uncharacterized protein n=1 Tax=Gallibacterium anatis TaxID=750 RepID=A0A930UX65_9PAST|nr:hypothetical protein [Gallibacterium anatis]
MASLGNNLFYCGCALHLVPLLKQRSTRRVVFASPKENGERKGTPERLLFSFLSDFPGGKTDFSSKLEKLTLFLSENLPCIRASIKGTHWRIYQNL